jgi:uncharacterized protein (DUF952 family)
MQHPSNNPNLLIYKIFRASEWAEFRARTVTHGAVVDLSDGFIHFSAAAQLGETLRRHFGGETNLMCLCVRAGRLHPGLVWEVSRGGAYFPHLYGPLCLSDLDWARPVAGAGGIRP